MHKRLLLIIIAALVLTLVGCTEDTEEADADKGLVDHMEEANGTLTSWAWAGCYEAIHDGLEELPKKCREHEAKLRSIYDAANEADRFLLRTVGMF